jgi:hypothetical protein
MLMIRDRGCEECDNMTFCHDNNEGETIRKYQGGGRLPVEEEEEEEEQLTGKDLQPVSPWTGLHRGYQDAATTPTP